jgi:hypothetical protein
MRGAWRTALAILAFGAAACGPPSKHEILKKAEGIETKQELEAALGAPDDVSKLGPVETWRYLAEDGEVTFLIAGDRVRFEAAGGDGEAQP